jgi:hypothetical protein
MAFFPLGLFFVTILWIYGFIQMEKATLLPSMISISCFILPIPIITTAIEYITENSGTLATATLTLSTTTESQLVLIDVFFLFLALLNAWNIVTGHKKKADD